MSLFPLHSLSFIALFFLLGCSCFLPLGMKSGYLLHSALSASTTTNASCIPQFSRLNNIPASVNAGSWCTHTNDDNQWLQISFGREITVTRGGVSNGLCEHLRACEQCVYFCEQWSISSCEQRALEKLQMTSSEHFVNFPPAGFSLY